MTDSKTACVCTDPVDPSCRWHPAGMEVQAVLLSDGQSWKWWHPHEPPGDHLRLHPLPSPFIFHVPKPKNNDGAHRNCRGERVKKADRHLEWNMKDLDLSVKTSCLTTGPHGGVTPKAKDM
ncbi:hypothetical protein Z043_104915, partial [Scleropages formosus]